MSERIASQGLSQKSAKISLLTVSAALIFATVLMIFFQFLSLRKSVLEDLTVQSKIIAENSVAAIVFSDRRASEETLHSLRASPSVEAAAVFTAYDTELAQYVRSSHAPLAVPAPELLSQGYQFQLNELTVAQNVFSEGRSAGSVVLHADLRPMYERLLASALITMSIVIGSLGFAYLLVARMRGALSTAEARLTYLAHVDSVTGLPNRHAFNEQLTAAILGAKHSGGSVDLLLLDLDNFKFVNDTLGHDYGDQLLQSVAQRLTASVRDTDIVCRIGGDEFAIILKSAGNGSVVAAKIAEAISAPYLLGQHEICVTGSIGISCCPDDGDDLPSLTRNADTAMYQAKALGKNTFAIFTREMDQSAQKRLALETKLRKALERNELMLHYQPKVRLADGRIIGFEALLRWNDPELGLVSPADFIPVAEESGLMIPIGRWVLQTACRDIAAWRDQGLGDISVAVNLSVRQTKDPELLNGVLAALRHHAVAPAQLELEITESVLMEHIESNIALLNQLRFHGIRLSIDDFGTGYSSMAYLKRFNIDELKIDRTFVKDIPDNSDDKAIVTAIVALAHNLGLSTVAEGVETERQVKFLRSIRCDSVQGFYFSKPIPFAKVAEFLEKTHCSE